MSLSIGGSGRPPFSELICKGTKSYLFGCFAQYNYFSIAADSSMYQPFQHFGQALLAITCMKVHVRASSRIRPAREISAGPYSAPLHLPAWMWHAT